MKHAAPIPGWDIRNGFAPALIIGSVSVLLALTVTLLQPPAYRAGIRILSTGGFSADEAEAVALSPGVSGTAVRDPAVSGYNLAPGDFLSGAEVEQPLEGGVLRLTVRDADPNRAALRVQSWAGALCADLGEDAGCVETGPVPAERVEDYLFLKLLASGLLGAAVGFC